MSKYYRVRTQEQWDWLMQKLEKENDKLRTVSWFAPERKPTELMFVSRRPPCRT
ncbi:MAG TPA: hypothetical protein K8V00_02975 [Ligilactobacillus acidipiscis]|uniref:Uncharacterized protein n=1 Tax=Ligilactobacillus acidipiscis TaxID=89059 RepID=A0A921F724_9LACO|nr:hypothetical protein [Ligilactobacillus acidipiscis]